MKNNKKVVMILAEPCHNDSRVMREAKTLAAAGYELVILALHKKGLEQVEGRDGYKIIRLCSWLPGNSVVAMIMKEIFFYICSFVHILWIRPAVCHIHNPRALMPGVCAAKLVGAKIIYDSWAEAVHRTDFLRWIFRVVVGIENYFACRVDVVFAVSGSIGKILRRRFRRSVFLIRNVSNIFFCDKNDLLKKALELDDDKRKIILYQGLFSGKRGIFEIIEAMQWVSKEAVLVFLGGEGTRGVRKIDMQAKIEEVGLANRIFIYGPVSADLVLIYTASADVGVCALNGGWKNHRYSLANKFFSYLMAGLPVAVSNLPEMGKLVRKYGVGVTFDPTDPQDIAEKLNTLLVSNGVYKKSIARFNQVFNWQREGRRLLRIYKKLLSI
jgi:glycosyltransferase involved in cell wall biosynthesis